LNFILDSNIIVLNNGTNDKNQIRRINYRINNLPLDKIYNDYLNISNLIVKMGQNYHNLEKYNQLALKYQNLINNINLKNESSISIEKKQIADIKYLYYNLTYTQDKRNYTFYFSLKDTTIKTENQ